MTYVASFRLIALFMTGCAVLASPNERIYYYVMASFGLCHYALALYYSRTRLLRVILSPRSAAAFAALALVGFWLMAASFSFYEGYAFKLILYFGVHHAFNEWHFSQQELRTAGLDTTQTRVSGTVLHGTAYLLLISKDNQMAPLNPTALLIGLSMAVIFHGATLWATKSRISFARLLSVHQFELLLVALAVLVYLTPLVVRFIDVVMFHFLYWALQPLPKLAKQDRDAVWRYATATVGFMALAILLSPVGIFASQNAADGTYFHFLFVAGSYLHITTSFALSSAQPLLIQRLFAPGAPWAQTTVQASKV